MVYIAILLSLSLSLFCDRWYKQRLLVGVSSFFYIIRSLSSVQFSSVQCQNENQTNVLHTDKGKEGNITNLTKQHRIQTHTHTHTQTHSTTAKRTVGITTKETKGSLSRVLLSFSLSISFSISNIDTLFLSFFFCQAVTYIIPLWDVALSLSLSLYRAAPSCAVVRRAPCAASL